MAEYMPINESVKSNEGRAYVTIGGQNRRLAELSKLEANITVKTRSRQPLGSRFEQTKATGLKISGSVTLYLMTSDWMDYAASYAETGKLAPVSIQAITEDPDSSAGRCEVLLTGVILSNVGLAVLSDSDDADATFTSDFTANGMKVLRRFNAVTE